MLSKRARVWLGLITILSLLSLASSCSKGGDDNAGETDKQLKKYTSKNDEGSITGKISYSGTAPEAKKISTDADPACSQHAPNLMTEEWVVKDGKVANTFVYIKSGTVGGAKISEYDGNSFPATKSAATLDQNGCHYKPHVLGVMVNQDITITNSDPTTHNIHFTPKLNTDWNQSQPNGAAALTHKLARAEVLVPVKCNQHPWMKSYIGVLKHPFFDVSAEDGSFEIKGVPPGKYTVVAWHEGGATGTEKTMEVTVTAKTPATADFTFGGTTALLGQPGSLPMMPALEFPMLNKH